MSLLAQDEALARKVGGIVIVLLALAIGFFVFVAGDLDWGRRVRMTVYFHHTGELREGAPVIVAGRSIGSVEAIGLVPRGTVSEMPEGGVAVMLDLSAAATEDIARGGDFFIAGRGPLSARHLEIGPSPTPDGPTLAADHRPVRGNDPPTLDRVVQRTWDNLVATKRFADEVAPEFRQLRDELVTLSATLDTIVPDVVGALSLRIEVEGLLAEATKLRAALGGDRGLDQIAATATRARATIAQARKVLDALDSKATLLAAAVDQARTRIGQRGPDAVRAVESAIAKLRAAIDKIDPLLAKIEDLNARIARGEGTIGRLARDPEFPEDAKELGKIMKRQPWRIFMRPKD